MAQITISGDTSGSITLVAPAVSGSTVLTLPTTSATLITDSSGVLNIGSGQVYKDASGNVGIGTSSPSTYVSNGGLVLFNPFGTSGTALSIANTSGASASAISKIDFRLSNTWGGNERAASIWALNPNALGNNGGALVFATSAYGLATVPIEQMRIDSSGNLLVGTTSSTSPSAGKVTAVSDSNGSYQMMMNNTNTGAGLQISMDIYRNSTRVGYITTTNTAAAFTSVSDQRLKTNIVDAPSALASVNAIKVRSFDWKLDGSHQEYGYIAQELLEVAPEAVTNFENKDDMMAVDFGKLTPRLVKAIQELKAIIDTQQEQINSLLGK